MTSSKAIIGKRQSSVSNPQHNAGTRNTVSSTPIETLIYHALSRPALLNAGDAWILQRKLGNQGVIQLFKQVAQQQSATAHRTNEVTNVNRIGLPDKLKAVIENLSGIDMSDVRVHYNSDKPGDLGAFAYTRGTEIYVAPGQERTLPHEAWHVVQQSQRRVVPTQQAVGVKINDEGRLEREADEMGARVKAGMFQIQHVVLSETFKSSVAPPNNIEAIFASKNDIDGNLNRTRLSPLRLSNTEPVQGYFIHLNHRVSDDGLSAVSQEQPSGGHTAYAEAGKAAASNAIRGNSRVKLYESGYVWNNVPNRTNTAVHNLRRVLAYNITTNTWGDTMTLERDCGVSSSQVMGGYNHAFSNGDIRGMGNRRGVYRGNRLTSLTGDPAQMQLEIMTNMFERLRDSTLQAIQQDTVLVNTTQIEITRLEGVIAHLGAHIAELRRQLFVVQRQAGEANTAVQNMEPLYRYYVRAATDSYDDVKYCRRRLDEYILRRNNRLQWSDQRDVEDGIQHYQRRLHDAEDTHRQILNTMLTGGTVRQLLTTYENKRNDLGQYRRQIDDMQIGIAQQEAALQLQQQNRARELQTIQNIRARMNDNRVRNDRFVQAILRAAAPGTAEEKANRYILVFRTFPDRIRSQLSAELGINEYAVPEIGEANVIARGGNAGAGGGGWNFHWGAVVLKSGSDSITLENDASTMPAGANTRWRFQMYGSGSQSFHAQNNDQNTYNTDPTTIRVRL